MEPLYILFVVSGGVFVVLMLALFFFSLEQWKSNSNTRNRIAEMYGDENIAKMEYDLAFYDGDLYSRRARSDSAKQVTFDDVFSGRAEESGEIDELTRFNPIAEAEDKVIVGRYDPETSE